MSPALRRKLMALAERHEEVARLLAEPDVIADAGRFRSLSREFAQLEPVAVALAREAALQADLREAEAMLADPD
ncbi:MAG: PCRF domain-containing protein, partial [Lysobacteraceae bacterium]